MDQNTTKKTCNLCNKEQIKLGIDEDHAFTLLSEDIQSGKSVFVKITQGMACVKRPRVNEGSWCGSDYAFFLGLDHAAAAILSDTTAQPCLKCIKAAIEFLGEWAAKEESEDAEEDELSEEEMTDQ